MVRALMHLGEGGIYSVSEVCRILQPGMTPRKVHYWLNTGLLSEPPVHHRGPGIPTLLSFRQLLEIRTVQRLRDDLNFSLRRVREAFAWMLTSTFAEESDGVRFERWGTQLIARSGLGEIVVPTNQYVMPQVIDGVQRALYENRHAWLTGTFRVPSIQTVECNTRVMAGVACIAGTRIDTSVIAAFADDEGAYNKDTVAAIRAAYPSLAEDQIADVLEFEGIRAA